MSKIDMHVHSNCSNDADFDPEVLINMAKENNVQVFSIADHNSVKAYHRFNYLNVKDLKIIPAIELDCTIDNTNLHVLGYNIDVFDPIFEKISNDIDNQEIEASQYRLAKIRELGIIVNEDKINKLAINGIISGEMIAEVALNDPLNQDNELLKPYREKGSRADNPYVNFYWDYCAQNKIAYAKVNFNSLQETVDIIHKTNGIAILAHPGNNIHEDEELLAKIMNSGVDGIEVYSSYHNDEKIAFYLQKAKEYQCLITCGSDFHGKNKPKITIGCVKVADEEIIMNNIIKSLC